LLPVLKSADGGGDMWLDDVSIDGRADDFARDPGWEGLNNRKEYVTTDIRPRFDFGYSPTQYAGGQKAGRAGWARLSRRLPLPGPDGRVRGPARDALPRQATQGVRQGGPPPRSQRQHGAHRVLPFGGQPVDEPLAVVRVAAELPRGGRRGPES